MNRNTTNTRDPVRPLLAQINGAIPVNGYKTTPTSRNGSGHHADSKPVDGPAQWKLDPSGKLPWRAFEVHQKERERFWSMAACVPLDGREVEQVTRMGGGIYDASLRGPAAKFESEIAVGQLELDCLNAERGRIERDAQAAGAALEDIQPTTHQEPPAPHFPPWFSVKWWAMIGYAALTILSSAAAILIIAHLFLPALQSWLFSCIAASPWVLAAVAVETFILLSFKADSIKVGRVLRGALLVLVLGLVLWLVGLLPLAAPVDINAQTVLLPDRRLAVTGQLLCEAAIAFLLINGLLKTLDYRRVIVPNPNRATISRHISDLWHDLARVNREVDRVMTQLANANGNLQEWQASRASFIEEGLCILNLRASEAALIAELQRQRDEKQKLLARFTPN